MTLNSTDSNNALELDCMALPFETGSGGLAAWSEEYEWRDDGSGGMTLHWFDTPVAGIAEVYDTVPAVRASLYSGGITEAVEHHDHPSALEAIAWVCDQVERARHHRNATGENVPGHHYPAPRTTGDMPPDSHHLDAAETLPQVIPSCGCTPDYLPPEWSRTIRTDGGLALYYGEDDEAYIIEVAEQRRVNISVVSMHTGASWHIATVIGGRTRKRLLLDAVSLGRPRDRFDALQRAHREAAEAEAAAPIGIDERILPPPPRGHYWDSGAVGGSVHIHTLVEADGGQGRGSVTVRMSDPHAVDVCTIRDGQSIKVNEFADCRQAGEWLLAYLAAEIIQPRPQRFEADRQRLHSTGEGWPSVRWFAVQAAALRPASAVKRGSWQARPVQRRILAAAARQEYLSRGGSTANAAVIYGSGEAA